MMIIIIMIIIIIIIIITIIIIILIMIILTLSHFPPIYFKLPFTISISALCAIVYALYLFRKASATLVFKINLLNLFSLERAIVKFSQYNLRNHPTTLHLLEMTQLFSMDFYREK